MCAIKGLKRTDRIVPDLSIVIHHPMHMIPEQLMLMLMLVTDTTISHPSAPSTTLADIAAVNNPGSLSLR